MSVETAARLEAMLARIPYARLLGVHIQLAGDEMTAFMPYAAHLIGNPTIPALHGGALGALMEMTAMAQLSITPGLSRQPRPIDVTVAYLRTGRPADTFARAEIKRLGRRVANVHVEAWQESRARPIASLHGHFHVTMNENV